MKEKYLVINAGSSSLKFSLYEMPGSKEIVNGIFEKIGKEDSFYTLKYNGEKKETFAFVADHTESVKKMLKELLDNGFINSIDEICGIGHRVLHGGEIYSDSVIINDEVLNNIKLLTKLGPLHHPGEIAAINSMKEVLPNVPQIAVFDTAFHQTIPQENYTYAVPEEWYTENGVRKYGFHGTSHKYITERMKEYYNRNNINIIICHIGSGASISCIKDGKCFDTTMGLTPLDGLVMGTRSGSIDPSIIQYISKERNLSVDEITNILNKESGLQGLCGKSDNRDIEKLISEKNERGILAMNMLKNSIAKYIAQYYMELNGDIDALVFTAGIGENGILLREMVIDKIAKPLNIRLNREANNNIARYKANKEGIISTDDSDFKILVLHTDEESVILKDTYLLVHRDKEMVKKLNK